MASSTLECSTDGSRHTWTHPVRCTWAPRIRGHAHRLSLPRSFVQSDPRRRQLPPRHRTRTHLSSFLFTLAPSDTSPFIHPTNSQLPQHTALRSIRHLLSQMPQAFHVHPDDHHALMVSCPTRGKPSEDWLLQPHDRIVVQTVAFPRATDHGGNRGGDPSPQIMEETVTRSVVGGSSGGAEAPCRFKFSCVDVISVTVVRMTVAGQSLNRAYSVSHQRKLRRHKLKGP